MPRFARSSRIPIALAPHFPRGTRWPEARQALLCARVDALVVARGANRRRATARRYWCSPARIWLRWGRSSPKSPIGLVELRLLAAGFSHRIGVVAEEGNRDAVARSLAQGLASVRPQAGSVVFEGIDGTDPWPDLIAAHWPSAKPPRRRTDATMDAPVLDLDASYEEWMERRERRFRKEARRTARRMEEEEVRGKIACDDAAIGALLRLHDARWEERGGSNVDRTARAMLERAARALGPEERLWVALLEAPSGAVAAELVVRAGDTAVFWAGGFDPAWARNAPGTQAMLLALRHIAEQKVKLADLGGGDHDYKRRLADRNTTIVWRTIFPENARYPLMRLRLAPKHTGSALRKHAQRLPRAGERAPQANSRKLARKPG